LEEILEHTIIMYNVPQDAIPRSRRRQGQARRKRRKGGSRGEGEAGAALGTEERQGASGRGTGGEEGRR
jgi:hypothetical protein